MSMYFQVLLQHKCFDFCVVSEYLQHFCRGLSVSERAETDSLEENLKCFGNSPFDEFQTTYLDFIDKMFNFHYIKKSFQGTTLIKQQANHLKSQRVSLQQP